MVENPIVGVWRLVSCDAIRQSGTRIPIYGRRPVGRLVYDPDGNMSVQIMRSDRRSCESDTKFGASAEEKSLAFEGYEAYSSTYVLDTELKMINHKVVCSLFPNWTGSIQTRYYALDGGNRLRLSTAPIGATPSENAIVTLVWERVETRQQRSDQATD